jgi:hypothetical protein
MRESPLATEKTAAGATDDATMMRATNDRDNRATRPADFILSR